MKRNDSPISFFSHSHLPLLLCRKPFQLVSHLNVSANQKRWLVWFDFLPWIQPVITSQDIPSMLMVELPWVPSWKEGWRIMRPQITYSSPHPGDMDIQRIIPTSARLYIFPGSFHFYYSQSKDTDNK